MPGRDWSRRCIMIGFPTLPNPCVLVRSRVIYLTSSVLALRETIFAAFFTLQYLTMLAFFVLEDGATHPRK